MVFGKGQQTDVITLGRKGGETSNKLHGSKFNKLWQDKEWRMKKQKEGTDWMTKLNNRMTKEEFRKHCSDAGKKSRERENKVVEAIKKGYDILFMPSMICDRIAVKGGRLIFIEIKSRKYKKLLPKQQEFKELCGKLGFDYLIYTD